MQIVPEKFVERAPCRYPWKLLRSFRGGWSVGRRKCHEASRGASPRLRSCPTTASWAWARLDVNFFIDELAKIKGRIEACGLQLARIDRAVEEHRHSRAGAQ
jgi:hypothetical protein